MRVSWNWLKDYVDLKGMTPDEVGEHLTSLGLEVEGIESASTVDGKVVIGKVLEAAPHPSADKLKLCQVDAGDGEPLQIVCGAPNARAGIHVAVARVGAVLPGDFKIKKSKIRGEVSFGMMCSAKELEIGEDHDGIIELPENKDVTYTLGESVAEALGIGDTVIDINITPNRADCNGMIGIARDLAAKTGRAFTPPSPQPSRQKGLATEGHVKIVLTDSEGCSRFEALRIRQVRTVASPQWLQQRLTGAGMRPINLVVDVTNYVMLEYSQPIHAYDERDIKGRTIEVRRAQAGETLETLDGQTRDLLADDLLICDEGGPIGLAGVMGGANSEVKDDTTDIIVEVAYFAPLLIRKTSRRLGLHTEASHRFERGVDIEALPDVAARVAELLQQCTNELNREVSPGGAGGGSPLPLPEAAEDTIDAYPQPVKPSKIALRVDRAKKLLALNTLNQGQMIKHLEALQFRLLDKTDERMVFEVPSWRADIEREVDLIEEVGRLEGFDKIPYQLPEMNIRPTREDDFIDFCESVRAALASRGYRETINFAFASPEDYGHLGIAEGHPLSPSLHLRNPISEEFAAMQTTLVPNLLRAALKGLRHGFEGLRLFECGRGYFDFRAKPLAADTFAYWRGLDRAGRHTPPRARSDDGRPVERHWLGAVMCHPFVPKGWNTSEVTPNFFHVKQVIHTLGHQFGVQVDFNPVDQESVPFLNVGQSAFCKIANNVAGYLGELHPKCAERLGLDPEHPPLVFELDLERFFKARGKGRAIHEVVKRFPPATRDIAWLVDRDKTHGDFAREAQKFKGKKHLASFTLFDVYEGERIAEDKKSMAYRLAFQSSERTLTDKEVDGEMSAFIKWMSEKLGATQR